VSGEKSFESDFLSDPRQQLSELFFELFRPLKTFEEQRPFSLPFGTSPTARRGRWCIEGRANMENPAHPSSAFFRKIANRCTPMN
jgi:hypothetical protein